MSEPFALMMHPDETVKAFNGRLREVCQTQPITGVQMDLVDGLPLVTLAVDFREATEEDVDAGLANEVGEEVVEGAPLECGVCRLHATKPSDADHIERRLEKLFDLADGRVEDVEVQTGKTHQWIELPTDGKKASEERIPIWAEVSVTWAMVIWQAAPEDASDEDEDGEGTSDAADQEEEAPPPAKKKATKKKASKKAAKPTDTDNGDEE